MNDHATGQQRSPRRRRWLILGLLLLASAVGGWLLLQYTNDVTTNNTQTDTPDDADATDEPSPRVDRTPPYDPDVGPYSSLRRRAVHEVGINRLQDWAVSVLDNPPSEFAPAGPEGQLRPQDVPPDIRQMASDCFIVYNAADPERGIEGHIHFACGGGFYHYGIRVGRPGFDPRPDRQFHFDKLGNGVWGMYEQ